MNTRKMVPVTEAVYQAEGKPALTKVVPFSEVRRCGNCREKRECAQAARVLTHKFGSWDDVHADKDGVRWLCLPCSHSYRAVPYRRAVSLIHQDPAEVHWPSHRDLVSVLSAPLSTDVALVVPVRGKRPVLPRAEWGKVASDDVVFTWTSRHLETLRAGLSLIDAGVPKVALGNPSPPFDALMADAKGDQRLLSLWRGFAPARKSKVHLALFLRLLGTEKERASD